MASPSKIVDPKGDLRGTDEVTMGVVRALHPGARAGSQPDVLPDAALVEAARIGQHWAQEALFFRYGRMAAGLAHRLLGPGDSDVDDLVQDAFVAALGKLDTLRAPEAFSSWLGAIVVRLATKRLRRRSLARRLGLLRPEEADFEPVAGSLAPPDRVLELRQIHRMLHTLPADERVALVLRRVDGLSLDEIAEHMGISLSTAKRRVRDGEERLDRVAERADRVRPTIVPQAGTGGRS